MSEHGYGPYTRGCRCAVCRSAKAEYMRTRRAAGRVMARKHTTPILPGQSARTTPGTRFLSSTATHGTIAGYVEHGCRCFDCTDAKSAKTAAENARRKAREAGRAA